MTILVKHGYTVSRWHRACSALRIIIAPQLKRNTVQGVTAISECMHTWFFTSVRTVRGRHVRTYVRQIIKYVTSVQFKFVRCNSTRHIPSQLSPNQLQSNPFHSIPFHAFPFHPSTALSSATVYVSSRLVHLPFPLISNRSTLLK